MGSDLKQEAMMGIDKAARERAERKHPNNQILRDRRHEDFKAVAAFISRTAPLRATDRSSSAAPMTIDTYDAGLLASGGGGDVGWWHDYMRVELARAHEFYEAQLTSALAAQQEAQWQPIETAPRGKKVQLAVAGEGEITIGDWADYCVYNSPGFTHWAPFVPPPPAIRSHTSQDTKAN